MVANVRAVQAAIDLAGSIDESAILAMQDALLHDSHPEHIVAFAGRLDLPALAQVAVAHPQFETIHPFPDGHGRTGRALVHAMFHHLGVTRSVAVPISHACLQAVANGRLLVREVTAFATTARAATTARRGSAAWRAIDAILTQPVINATTLAATLGVTPQNAQAGIDRLVADGVLSQADGLLEALDAFAARARRGSPPAGTG